MTFFFPFSLEVVNVQKYFILKIKLIGAGGWGVGFRSEMDLVYSKFRFPTNFTKTFQSVFF